MKDFYRASVIAVALATTATAPVYAQDITISAEELAQMRAQLQAMDLRISQLESELDQAEAQIAQQASVPLAATTTAAAPPPATEVNWKGAPQLEHEDGWTFKPRGRLMYDAGFTNAPDSTGRDDGFGNEVRRARLGVQGDMPGGFGYKFELDFAGNDVEAADAFLSYQDGPIEVVIGHHNNFQSLEELTSSLNTSFIERAAFTDAFGFERRIGASVTYKQGIVLAQAGVFTDNFDDTGSDNRGVDGRIVVMPKAGDAQIHLGASVHYNDIDNPAGTVRYRQRPLVHFTGERFINTGNLGADSEFGFGLEGAVIAGRFHAAAEGFWQEVNRPMMLADPTFFGGYVEAGIFLTDDSRGYKSGKFDRIKPNEPVGEGGMGALQFVVRYDHLDLNDAGIVGGMQDGYFASLIWTPTDWTRFMMNYGKLDYTDAVHPAAGGDTSYSVDAFGVRAQIDF